MPGTGLGILRSDQAGVGQLRQAVAGGRAKAHEQRLLVLTKANTRSTVHRSVYLDYVGVKKFDDDGRGHRRAALPRPVHLVGLHRERHRASRCCAARRAGGPRPGRLPGNSHSGKDLLEILETYPRDELFQTDTDQLLPVVTAVLHLQERRQLRLFLRRDDYGRFVSCLVYLPRDRYTTDVRLKMQRILLDAFGGRAVDYTARVSESVLARLHFVVRMPTGQPLPDVDADRARAAARRGHPDVERRLLRRPPRPVRRGVGVGAAAQLRRRVPRGLQGGLPRPYRGRRTSSGSTALGDDPSALDLNLYEPYGASRDERRFKVYRVGSPISLSVVLPVLQEMGVEVVDERPYEIERRDGVNGLGLRLRAALPR